MYCSTLSMFASLDCGLVSAALSSCIVTDCLLLGFCKQCSLLSSSVAMQKAGPRFEATVRNKEKANPRFAFLLPWNQFHPYYRYVSLHASHASMGCCRISFTAVLLHFIAKMQGNSHHHVAPDSYLFAVHVSMRYWEVQWVHFQAQCMYHVLLVCCCFSLNRALSTVVSKAPGMMTCLNYSSITEAK